MRSRKLHRISVGHGRELASLCSRLPSLPLEQLQQQATLVERLRQWCERALQTSHLVAVASTLANEMDASDAELEALGLPVDLLELFPSWRRGSRDGFRPRGLGIGLLPAGAGEPLGTLRLQLSSIGGSVAIALVLVRDMLRRMDPGVQLCVTVEPGANIDGLRALVRSFHPSADLRVRFVEGRTVTLFAQDNALAARAGDGSPVLLVPRGFMRGRLRAEDELSPDEARAMFDVEVIRSSLYWEGGNMVHDAERCLVGVDTICENMARVGLTAAEVLAILRAELGTEVVPLGDLAAARFDAGEDRVEPSGQAAFHLDLDLCLLGKLGRKRKPRALIADPSTGLDVMDLVLARQRLFTGHFVPPSTARELIAAEYEAFAHARHPKLLGYCATLEELGYAVEGVPDLRIDPKENLFATVNLDFGYCNVLPGIWRGRPAVYYLPWGLGDLDRLAEERFRAVGAHPVRLASTGDVASSLMQLLGGLHCFCGQL